MRANFYIYKYNKQSKHKKVDINNSSNRPNISELFEYVCSHGPSYAIDNP